MTPSSHLGLSSFALARLRRLAGLDFGLGRYRSTLSAMASRILGGIGFPFEIGRRQSFQRADAIPGEPPCSAPGALIKTASVLISDAVSGHVTKIAGTLCRSVKHRGDRVSQGKIDGALFRFGKRIKETVYDFFIPCDDKTIVAADLGEQPPHALIGSIGHDFDIRPIVSQTRNWGA